MHTVIQVKPTADFKIYVYFDDGKIKLYDAALLVNQGIFKKISPPNVFMETCTVMHGTVAWDIGGNFNEYECLDLDPETLYLEGIDVKDPLSDAA
jgi:hypothetical protein